LLARHGSIIGGTDLFVLLQSENCANILARLAAAHIHVRDFAEQPKWLRFGLPGDEAAWKRLEAAL
jgi:cobalamin biosynthetic protein CobC